MSEQLPADARVFAVASGKGGVGKTTTAVNAGAALAASGAETVVVDADLGMANVADLLDLSLSGPTLQDVLAGELPVEKATYRTHAGTAVVPGATDLDAYSAVDPERLRALVETLRAEFEYVFLDAGAGLSLDSALPLGLADAVVLVTTPDESATRDAAKTREVAERIDASVAGVVVTRVRGEPPELDPDAVAERVGVPVLAAVPEDGAVREAHAAGRPAVTHDPEGRVTTAYRRLAAALTGREAVEPVAESSGSTDADEATSLEELLEREADRPDDVSALTGDVPDEDDDSTDEPTPDAAADPTPDAADDPADTPDDPPSMDLDDAPSDSLEADASASASSESDEPATDDLGAGTDGDIVIAEEAPLDDGDGEVEGDAGDGNEDAEDAEDGEDAGDAGVEGDDEDVDRIDERTSRASEEGEAADDRDDADESSADDPMANIPRFEEESAEEFTRGSEATDALAADPLDAGPDDGAVAPADGEDGMGTDELAADEAGRDPGDEPAGGDDSAEGDEVPPGPHVELDEEDPDASGGSGLLGRLAGLFR